MKPRELAIVLNVSQGQIHRCLREGTTPTRYMMETWAREMREAEMYLREWIRDVKPETQVFAPENCKECGAPFNNAEPGPNGRCPACNAE